MNFENLVAIMKKNIKGLFMEVIKKCISNDPYVFDTNVDGIPIFTQKNLKFLHAIIDNDSNYRNSQDDTDTYFETSYAGLLKKHSITDDPIIMEQIIKSIDKINSTHLSSEGHSGGGNGIQITLNRIMKIDNLKHKLETKNTDIVVSIARAVKDTTNKNKINFSFATKFCAYTSIIALEKDNYCIYDTVVQNILPYYAYIYLNDNSYYRTKRTGENCSNIESQFKQNLDYSGYRNLIDRIIDKIEEDIGTRVSYKDFDNLLWYYFKGTDSRIKKAMSLLPKK